MSLSFLSLAQGFFNETCKNLHISPQEAKKLGISPRVAYKDTHPTPCINFQYQNFAKEFVDFNVIRLHDNWLIGDYKKRKYIQPQGIGNRYYLNPFHIFVPPLLHTLFFVEGQKKTIALCKNGIPTIGVSGINGVFTHSEKEEKIARSGNTYLHKTYHIHSQFEDCCKQIPFQQAVLFIDNDFNKHGGKDERFKNFREAIKSFVWACKQTKKTPYLVALTDEAQAKAFDDIKDKGIKAQVVEGLNKLESNVYLNVYRLTDFSEEMLDFLIYGNAFTQYFTQNTYLSQDANLCKNLTRELITQKNLLIWAKTGKGKTLWLINLINKILEEKTIKGRMVIVFPTNSLLDSLEKLIKGNSTLVINQYTSSEIRERLSQALNSHQVILTTYQSYHKIVKDLTPVDWVFFDEFHTANLKGGINFYDSEDGCVYFKKAYKDSKLIKKIHLTATPILSFFFTQQSKIIKIDDHIPQVKPNLKVYKTTKLALPYQVNDYIAQLSRYTDDLHLLFLQNKEDLKEVAARYVQNFEVQLWYSDDEIKQTTYYKTAIATSKFVKTTTKPLLILATSFIYEGISFTNEKISSVAIFGENTPQNIIQALNRGRCFDANTLFSVYLTKKETAPYPISFLRKYKVALHSPLLHNGVCEDNELFNDFESLRIDGSYTHLLSEGGCCFFELCRTHNTHTSLLEYLQLEFTVNGTVTPPNTHADDEESIEQIEGNTVSDEQEAVEVAAWELLVNEPQVAAQLVYNHTQNSRLKKKLRQEYTVNFQPLAKGNLLEGYELEKYFSLWYRVKAMNITPKTSQGIWALRSERKANGLMEGLKIWRVINKGQQNTINNLIDNKEAHQINFIYQCLVERKNQGICTTLKEMVNDIHEQLLTNYQQGEIGKLHKNKLTTTTEKYVRNVIKNLCWFKIRTVNGVRLREINFYTYEDFLRKNGLISTDEKVQKMSPFIKD